MVLPSPINAPISIGELLDKISILEIKKSVLTSVVAITNVKHELELLKKIFSQAAKVELHSKNNPLHTQFAKLLDINRQLWNIEDSLRVMESNKDFGEEFISLARSVYKTNDQRASLKKSINMLCKSGLIEEKSYGYK